MGIKQWIFQRISNIAIVSFGLWMFWLIVSPGEIDAVTIYEILNSTSNKIFFFNNISVSESKFNISLLANRRRLCK